MNRVDVQRNRFSLVGNCWHVSVTMFWLQCLVVPRLVIATISSHNHDDKPNPTSSDNTGNPLVCRKILPYQ
eukprot:7285969-Karenia_brevis.AAC.1